MGCTSSKENTNPLPPPTTTTISDNSQQLINEQFRQWLKSNRPKADEYVLNDVTSPAQSINDIDDYRPIVRKALDLLADRHDIKSSQKLAKLLQKELPAASSKKVAHTIDVLKQTAEKLRHGQLPLDGNQQRTSATANGEVTDGTKTSDNKHGQIASGEPGIVLKEALERARISFYKGIQAAIFANPNGGYDVRVIDENDDTLSHDGNLLRSIIVTEVKTRPKSTAAVAQFTTPRPPPPPPPKQLDEHEIGDDFRRSIDAALRGLEAIYQTTPPTAAEESPLDARTSASVTTATTDDHTANLPEIIHQGKAITHMNEERSRPISQTDIQPKLVAAIDDMSEMMVNTIESTTQSQIGDPIPALPSDTVQKLVLTLPMEEKQQTEGERERHDQSLPTKQISSRSVGFPSAPFNGESTTPSTSRQKLEANKSQSSPAENQQHVNEQVPSDQSLRSTSSTVKHEQPPMINPASTPPNQAVEGHSKTPTDPLLPPAVAPFDATTAVKSPGHNVTYTEIIHSESHDGEQSRRFITESYDEQPSKADDDDDETTSRKIITKSEFSHHPLLGEKIMEQSVQVITVKVRNETVTTTSSPSTPDNHLSSEKSLPLTDNTP